MSGLGKLSTVQGCPCGELHILDERNMAAYVLITSGFGPTIPIFSPLGVFYVNRVFVSCHPGEIIGGSLPLLAKRYGWRSA